MIKKLADKIALFYTRQKIIPIDELDVYSYGFELILSAVFNLSLVIAVAIIFNIPLQAFLFVFSFIIIRSFGGGYHAKTHMVCVWAFFIVFVSLSFVLNLLPMHTAPIVIFASSLTSLLFIWIAAPVEAKNKKLSDSKQKRLKRICRLIAIIYFVFAAYVFFIPTSFEHIVIFAFSGLLAGSTSIMFAALMNKRANLRAFNISK